MEITVETAQKLRLTAEEFELIKQKLGRTPNFTELCSFSAMWSEHCSYKNSIKWLKTLPRDGGRMLVAAGEENAGLMDMGGGFGVVFKSAGIIFFLFGLIGQLSIVSRFITI